MAISPPLPPHNVVEGKPIKWRYGRSQRQH